MTADRDWRSVIGRYLLATLLLDLAWETAHLRLYTVWEQPISARAIAVLHCTAGDLLIALTALIVALLAFGDERWPLRRATPVLIAATAIGVFYTIYSEWKNVSNGAWSYAQAMPIVPPFGTGLSPLLQWTVIPFVAFRWARRFKTPALRAAIGPAPRGTLERSESS